MRFYAFDCMLLDGESLLQRPFRERHGLMRQALEGSEVQVAQGRDFRGLQDLEPGPYD